MDILRVSRLTERQRLCLRLVHAHMSSKEIAPHLGVEPGTVDQYVKAAMAVLGVGDRRDAARMFAEYEAAKSSGAAGMARQAVFEAPLRGGWLKEALAATRHGLRNVLTFSGRDTSRQFWSYAAFLLILNCLVSDLVVVPMVTQTVALTQEFMTSHPGQAIARHFPGETPIADVRTMGLVLCLLALTQFALVAAAIVRRLRAGGRIELWVHLAIPLVALTFLLVPQSVALILSIQYLLCLLYALNRGGAPERVGASILLTYSLVDMIAFAAPLDRFQSEVVYLGALVVAFLGFTLLAMIANRFWPIWMTALMGFGLAARVTMLLNPEVTLWAMSLVLVISGLPIMLLLIVGTHGHRIRLARDGADPAWTRGFAPFRKPAPVALIPGHSRQREFSTGAL